MYLYNKTPIYGHAVSKKEYENSLDDIGYNIIEHIIKLYFYYNVGATTHWRREIFAFLHRVSVFKHNHRLPDANFLYKNLFTVNEHRIKRLALSVYQWYKDEYGEPDFEINDGSIRDVTIKASEYLMWISQKLSKIGDVLPQEVYEKLDELCLSERV